MKDLCDQTRPQMKGRRVAVLLRGATRDAKKDFSFCRGQRLAGMSETFTQSSDELTRSHQIGKHERPSRSVQHGVFDRAKQE